MPRLMTDEEFKAHYRRLTKIVVAIEDTVKAAGRMTKLEYELLLETNEVSELGRETIAAFLDQSDKVRLVPVEGLINGAPTVVSFYIEPNPLYIPEFIEDETTGIVLGRTPTKKMIDG